MTVLSLVSLSPSHSEAGTILTSVCFSPNMSMFVAYSHCWVWRRWEAEDLLHWAISVPELHGLVADSRAPRKTKRVKGKLFTWSLGRKGGRNQLTSKLALCPIFNVQFSGIKCMPIASWSPLPSCHHDHCLYISVFIASAINLASFGECGNWERKQNR